MVYFLPFSRSELVSLVTRELDFWSKMVCAVLSTLAHVLHTPTLELSTFIFLKEQIEESLKIIIY